MGKFPFKAIPGPKPSLPFIGTSWIYFPLIGYYRSMKLHEANLDKYNRYGPIMKEEYQRGYPTVTVFEPSDIRKVFMGEGTCPTRPVLPYVIKQRQADPTRYPNVGLSNMMGDEWLTLRRHIAPLLLSEDLKKRQIVSQNLVSNRLVNYIKSNILLDSNPTSSNQATGDSEQQQLGNPPTSDSLPDLRAQSGVINNIQDVFYRFSMESIMNLCINRQLGCLNHSSDNDQSYQELMKEGELIFEAAMNLFEAQHKLYYGSSLWKYFVTKPYRQLRDSQNTIHDIVSKYIDVALSDIKKRKESTSHIIPNNENQSLLSMLYNVAKFSDIEIKSIIVEFIGGGIYTVANTLTMALFLLASNPQVQEQLHREVSSLFDNANPEDDAHIDLEKLEKLKFLKLCLKESYRLLPTIPGIARTLQKDTVLSNYVVPKNTLVFCNSMVSCRLPQYFENPDTFNPSRWERTGKSRQGDVAFLLLPFGLGKRKCIGHNFAEFEIYVALAKLIRSFKISTINNESIKNLDLVYKFIVVPEKPVSLRFTPRNSSNIYR